MKMNDQKINKVKEYLLGVHYAPAQKLRFMIAAVEYLNSDDWLIQGVFENNNEYSGTLSGVGIRLEPSAEHGFCLRALSGYKPLVPEAYITLSVMQSKKQEKYSQLWARWIALALKDDPLMSLKDADDNWLEHTFSAHHCCDIIDVEDYLIKGELHGLPPQS